MFPDFKALRTLLSWAYAVVERSRQVLRNRFGPNGAALEEARLALAGREHYRLYDDRYLDLHRRGLRTVDVIGVAKQRPLIDREFEWFRREGLIPGPGTDLIELGCGEGENAVHFAQLGWRVIGVDVSPAAIEAASGLARQHRLAIDFRVEDALHLSSFKDGAFDLAVDIGCLHMIVRSHDRHAYLQTVRRVLRPGGAFYLFSHVTGGDVEIGDEDEHILRSVASLERRWVPRIRTRLPMRGCGFRSASLRQYAAELEAAGFEVVKAHRHNRLSFCTLVARAADPASPNMN
jgi:SAM-dependent methyltransferase